MEKTIAVIKGDGIGPEIVTEALNVLEKVALCYGHTFHFEEVSMGGCAIDEFGEPLPPHTLSTCQQADAVLLGAVGGPKWDDPKAKVRPEQGLLALRSGMNCYANLRPAKAYRQLKAASPLKDHIVGDGFDIVMVRELTGGIYFGERGRTEDTAFDTERYTKGEIERIAVKAFELAAGRKQIVHSVDKANVLESSRLWRETVAEVGKRYPQVQLVNVLVDNAAMQIVRNPSQFDVLLTSNMFGDILSDELSMVTGSIGMLASASVGDGSRGVYEPIHGSAPDIAGKNMANPIATIASAAMLLSYSFGLKEEAEAVYSAIDRVLDLGYRTPDLHVEGAKKVGTAEMGRLICEHI